MTVAVLGAGYAGVTVAHRLEEALPADEEIVVVNDSRDHLIRHEIHRVIRRPDFADDLLIDLEDVLDRATLRVDRVTGVNPQAGRAELEDGALDYDYAVVCLGAETAFYDLPGVEDHGTPLREIEHARRIRQDFLDLSAGDRVVVGGAGLSGIQAAGELTALAREEDKPMEITLIERLDSVAPGFDPDFQAALRDELEERDVTVRTGTPIRSASADGIATAEDDVEYDQFVWTGGIRGTDSLDGERPRVRSDLRLGDGTFAVGDAARAVDSDGEAIPASAQAAIREAEVAATNVTRLVENADDAFEPRLENVSFSPLAWVVSVGDGAVAAVGPSILRGRAALAVKASAGIGHLASIGATRRAVQVAREEFGATR